MEMYPEQDDVETGEAVLIKASADTDKNIRLTWIMAYWLEFVEDKTVWLPHILEKLQGVADIHNDGQIIPDTLKWEEM